QPGEGRPLSGRKALAFVGLLAAAAVVIAILGIVPRVRARTALQEQTAALAAPDVLVARPQRGKVAEEVVLPGNVQAFTEAPIYARTSGYLRAWSFDIGAHVKKGQRLAVIASPEVEQQLQQGKADLATARANQKYAETQAARYQDLLNENAVSKQDTDNFRAQASSTSNQVAAAEANVRRLAQLTEFANVYAPFDGVITARNVDIGTLIDAGARRDRRPDGARAPGPHVHGPDRPDLERHRSDLPDAAGGGRRRQPEARAVSRRLRAGALQAAQRGGSRAGHPGSDADVPVGGAAGGGGARRQGAAGPHHHRPRRRQDHR